MKIHLEHIRKTAKPATGLSIIVIAALVMSGCGGSSNGTSSTLTGVVADGYLSGAKVCLDINSNGVCDAGEPFATTDTNGNYSITVAGGQSTQLPIVAEVPSTAIDKDTGAAVAQAFTLTAPAGASFVSPLTTLVNDKIATSVNAASAVTAVNNAIGINAASGVSALDNYVAAGTSTDQAIGYVRAREAAKTVAAVLKAGKNLLGSTSGSTDMATQSVLLDQAESVLQAQATSNVASPSTIFSTTALNASSVAKASTLKSLVAAKKADAVVATQAVTINFDVVNGATQVGTTGCTLNSLTLGSGNTVGSLKDLRFYVSNVALIDANGNYAPVVMDKTVAGQDTNLALMDFEDGTGGCVGGTAVTKNSIVGKVAPGTYTGIALTVGVPAKLNHTNVADTTLPAILQDTGMAWIWNAGRKFFKVEFTSNAVPGVTTMIHLGSVGCKATIATFPAGVATGEVFNGCASPNRVHFSFPTFNTATNKIALDLSALFSGTNLTANQTWMSGKGMMMSANTQLNYSKFGLDFVTGLDGSAQSIFVVK